MKSTRFLATAVAVAALILVPATVVHADTETVRFDVTVDKSVVHPGDEVTWTVHMWNNFPDDGSFTLFFPTSAIDDFATITSYPGGSNDTAQAVIMWFDLNIHQHEEKDFTVTAKVDANAAPGSQLVGLATTDKVGPMCITGGCHARATVASALGAEPPADATPPSLPKTGVQPALVATISATALAAGGMLVVMSLARRRPRRP